MLDKRNFKTKAIIRKKGEMGGQKKKKGERWTLHNEKEINLIRRCYSYKHLYTQYMTT